MENMMCKFVHIKYFTIFYFILKLLITNIMLILTLGSSSKKGPIHNKIAARIAQDTTDAICVTPPTVIWIIDLDKEAHTGIQEKNEPTMLLHPCKIH